MASLFLIGGSMSTGSGDGFMSTHRVIRIPEFGHHGYAVCAEMKGSNLIKRVNEGETVSTYKRRIFQVAFIFLHITLKVGVPLEKDKINLIFFCFGDIYLHSMGGCAFNSYIKHTY